MIEAGHFMGSAFTIEVDGRQYLITAKHLVAGLKSTDTIRIRKSADEEWEAIQVQIFRCDEPVDIAMLVPPKRLTVSPPLETGAKIRLGQDAFFAGFPFGVVFSKSGPNTTRPMPFLKKALFSAARDEGDATVLFLDGYNNHGFSGGPIVYRDLDRTDFVFSLMGVVSGFRPELIPILQPKKIEVGEDLSTVEPWRLTTLPDGSRAKLVDTEQQVATNTGIVIGYGINPAIDLIKRHPLGPKVTD